MLYFMALLPLIKHFKEKACLNTADLMKNGIITEY